MHAPTQLALTCLLAALACGPSGAGEQSPSATPLPSEGAGPDDRRGRSIPLEGNPIADLTEAIILEEFDALEGLFTSRELSQEEYALAKNFLSAEEGRLPGLVRKAAAEAGIPKAQVESTLSGTEFRQFLAHLSNSGNSRVSKRRLELSDRAQRLPLARNVEGGCDRVQEMVDARVEACDGIHFFSSVVRRRHGLGCPELKYKARAHAHHCIDAGHAWASEYLAEIERTARIEEASGRDHEDRWASEPKPKE